METQARNRKPSLLADPAIQLVLAGMSVILLGWPMIQIAGGRGMPAMFIYVFVVWGGLVILLFAVSRSLRGALRSADETGRSTSEQQ
jgi:hypothetical protein